MIPGVDKDVSTDHNRDVNLLATSRSPFSTGAAAYHGGTIVFPATDTVDLFLLRLSFGLLPKFNAVLLDGGASSLFSVRRRDDLACGGSGRGPPRRPRRPAGRDGTRTLRHA